LRRTQLLRLREQGLRLKSSSREEFNKRKNLLERHRRLRMLEFRLRKKQRM